MTPPLSVIVPTYGRGQCLGKLIAALRAQTTGMPEVIVVDQNPPGFLDAQLPTGVSDGVVFLRLPEPNASTARNVGFVASSSEFVLFIDDDLVPEPDFCERALAVLAAHAKVDCLCPVVYTDETELREFYTHKRRILTGETIPGTGIYGITDTASAAVFMRSSAFARSGGFDELLFRYARTAEDQEWFLRMRMRGMKAWMDRDLTVFHDHRVPGGCDLRTAPRWETRKRCVMSWALRYRLHRGRDGKLAVRDIYRLARSSFLNSALVRHGLSHSLRELILLAWAIIDSREYMEAHVRDYPGVCSVNHLTKYDFDAVLNLRVEEKDEG
jgi:glycosyltransferase involved in cell wall biosynthesis